jgi:hypothetical protein
LITGDGIIKSFTNPGAYARPAAAALGQNVIRAAQNPQTGWIINVAVFACCFYSRALAINVVYRNNVGTHTGTIMTNDTTNFFWQPNAAGVSCLSIVSNIHADQVILQTQVQLAAAPENWIFTP